MRLLYVLSIPILMLLDYYLTIYGAKLADKKHHDYFKSEQYELNPTFQADIKNRKLLSPRHLAMVILYTACMVFIAFFEDDDFIFQLVLGYLVILYLKVNQQHIHNILLFRYIIKNPDQLEGTISVKFEYSLKSSEYYCCSVILFLCGIFVFTLSPFILGGTIGMIVFYFTHRRWVKKYKSSKVESNSEG